MENIGQLLLQEVKELLNLTGDDSKDTTLKVIINNVYSRLILMTGYTEIPDPLLFIVTEVSITRYNKLGSEGIHTELNEGIQFIYERDIFSEYTDLIEKYIADHPPEGRKRFRMM